MFKNIFLFIVDFLSTTFFSGKIPGPKGTYGSFLALILMYFVFPHFIFKIILTLILIIFGIFLSDISEKYIYKKKDPSQITIDEVAGIFVTFIYLYKPNTFEYKYIILLSIGFIIFRIFDILKPYPINTLQNIKGGIGIMIDDLLAGIYSLILVNLISYFVG